MGCEQGAAVLVPTDSSKVSGVLVMPQVRHERIEPTNDWQQLELRVQSVGQRTYELIRPPTGEVRATGVTSAPNAVLHPWLRDELTEVLATLPAPTVPEEARP